MKSTIVKNIIVSFYILLLIVLASATFIEHFWGSSFVENYIYHRFWFCCLWGIMAILAVAVIARLKMWKQLPTFLLHVSFLIILAGALTTFILGKKGYVHLEINKQTNSFVERETGKNIEMPFSIELKNFSVKYYAGTNAPSDYVSEVCFRTLQNAEIIKEGAISMNHILECKRHRFYQSSYDDDGKGSWLTVNYDPYGTAITYTGYILLALSMILILINRKGEFRNLLKHPLLKTIVAVCIFLSVGFGNKAQAANLSIISESTADSLSVQQVIYQDRVVPYNTLARDFVKKLSGKNSFGGLSAEQIVGSWQNHPFEWQYVPIIKIKNEDLRQALGLTSNYARLIDLLQNNEYKLRKFWHPEKMKTGKPSSFEKAILETDEKVALILMLQNGTLIRPLPDDGSVKHLSKVEVQAEILYNKIPFSKILFMLNLTLGFLSLGLFLFRSLHCKTEGQKSSSLWKVVDSGLGIILWAVFLFHLFGYALRWFISGRIPLGNGYETMQFMALCILLLAGLLRKKFTFITLFGFLLSGFTLLVSYLGQMNPQITPLMPVLISPWLSIHVSVLMMSYALLAFIFLNGILAVCLSANAEKLMVFSRLLLYPAVFLMGIGIFIGAVWANVSWGRYWAWDPKEVWALISFMVYGMAFHGKSCKAFCNPKFFHIYMIFAFLTILMTYFGVNFFLGGMHSYA